jgi:type VI secretion system protein ImpG
MDDELLGAYDKELSWLRRAGVDFARSHPKIASRLRLGPDQIEDPHVSRLVESVAFLNARVRRKLDDEFPELTDALLGVLAPHFLAPVPSMSVVQFECAADLKAPVRIERGTGLVTDAVYGEACRFRTAYDVEAQPVAVESARLFGTPFRAPPTPRASSSAGLLHVALRPAHDAGSIGPLGIQSLRFFLNGEFRHMAALYELVLNDAVEVAVAASPEDRTPQILPASCLHAVGFEDGESVLPESSRSHPEHRLLTEYFAFPRKFLFFEIEGLRTEKLTSSLQLFVYLRRSVPELELLVSASTLVLGCTPIMNLFERKAEPIRLTGTQSEYHLIADARHQVETEIYSVDSVKATSRNKSTLEYAPFYGTRHDLDTSGAERYWHAARRATPRGEGEVDAGTEIFLSLVDDGFEAGSPDDWVLETAVTCVNRNLPARLPFGGGHPRMTFAKGGGAIKQIRCLTPPTQTVRPVRGRGALWRLVSLLALHHTSLVDGPDSALMLRECLRLFDPVAAPETRAAAEAIVTVESAPVVRRIVAGGQPGFCRGLQVRIQLDEERLRSSGTFLFATVLERFLAGYCTLNSFVETVALATGRDGEMRRWAPRSGSRILL